MGAETMIQKRCKHSYELESVEFIVDLESDQDSEETRITKVCTKCGFVAKRRVYGEVLDGGKKLGVYI